MWRRNERNCVELSGWNGIIAGFTARHGGVSTAPFSSWNLGLHVQDDETHVVENRIRLADVMGTTIDRLVFCEQVHGALVQRVTENDCGRGVRTLEDTIPGCDGFWTDEPNVALVSLYADCVPLYFWDERENRIGLCHAGWRGTFDEIGKTLLQQWLERGTNLANVRVAIGPCIQGCCFEVNECLYQKFVEKFSEQCVGQRTEDGRFLLDLSAINRLQLSGFGIPETNIVSNTDCTSCNTTTYFSHRKEKGQTGRLASYMMIK